MPVQNFKYAISAFFPVVTSVSALKRSKNIRVHVVDTNCIKAFSQLGFGVKFFRIGEMHFCIAKSCDLLRKTGWILSLLIPPSGRCPTIEGFPRGSTRRQRPASRESYHSTSHLVRASA